MITVHAVHAMYDPPQVLSRGMGIAATSLFAHESHNIFSNSWGTNRVDPHLTAATTFVSGGYCFADKKNKRPQLDQLAAKGDATFDTQERTKIYNRSRGCLFDQMFFLPLP